jgi:hypothetical protein
MEEVAQETMQDASKGEVSEKKRLPALLLCLLLGPFGIHRFYVGKLIDLIMIIVGSFKDKEGKVLEDWT